MSESGEIFFRCTVCRRRLAVEPRARGQLVDCPNCRASLRIPDHSTALSPEQARRRLTLLAMAAAFAGLSALAVPLLRSTEGEAAPATVESSSPAERIAATREPAPREEPAVPVESRELRDLQSAHRAISQQYNDLANWVLTNLRGRFLLKDQHVGRLRFPPVNDDFTAHPDLLDFLAVKPEEGELLNDAFAHSRNVLTELQQAFLTTTQTAPDRVTLYIPPFEREGAVLQEDLYGAMKAAIGPDRFNRLLQVGEQDLVRAYDYFGKASRTMVFQLVFDDYPRTPPHLLIKDGWIIPQDASRRTVEASEEAVRQLPERYHAYLAWLPDFVAAYAQP